MASVAPELRRQATYADLEALPPSTKGEIIDGVLYTQPRPPAPHGRTAAGIVRGIGGPYDLDPDGPGGWWILPEPGIELPGSPEVAPDVAGWRRERLPRLPRKESIRLAPDWVCEILSPSNRSYDRKIKIPWYAREGVSHLWVVDPDARTVEVKQLVGRRWTEIDVFSDDDVLCAEPFNEVKIPLAPLWVPAE